MAKQPPPAYEAAQIQALDDREHVRTRPHMFIPSTGTEGLHHLVFEAVDNAIDEVVNGGATKIIIQRYSDGSISIEDNGRGIPPEKSIQFPELSTLTVVLTMTGAGGKFGGEGSAFKTSGGLHGVGIKAVNFLSEWLIATVWRHGKEYQQKFKDGGIPVGKVRVVGTVPKGKTGTKIQFMPDPTIFANRDFDPEILIRRFRSLAFLNPKATIRWIDDLDGTEEVFHYKTGLVGFVEYMDKGMKEITKPILLGTKSKKEEERVGAKVSIAFALNEEGETNILAFANNILTPEGGVHLNAAVDGIRKAVYEQARAMNLFKGMKNPEFLKADVEDGLTMVVAIMLENPMFKSNEKTALNNPELRGPMGNWVEAAVADYFRKNREVAKVITAHVVQSMRARLEAKKVKAAVKEKKGFTAFDSKLTPCASTNPELSELYIVEGDSAGGTAKMARDPKYQAILPLKGVPINALKNTLSKMMDNKEIQSIFSALRANVVRKGRKLEVDLENLRYYKVIISSDADPDGGHITGLLLAFFYKYLRKMIENGHIYIAEPPLYQVAMKGKDYFMRDDIELKDFEDKHPTERKSISRLKGLGEMDAKDLRKTIMDPETRRLRKVLIEDGQRAAELLDVLYGEAVEPRKEFIMRNINFEAED